MGDSKRRYAFFQNRDCENFPCHAGVPAADFNCLFCYCPLYLLGDKCGGNFVMHPDGRKDCGGCLYPHRRESYGEIVRRYDEITKAMP